jgi:serine O-acetyltransferase
MRTCLLLSENIFLIYSLFPLARLILRKISFQLGISIPYKTEIGSGFYIGHFGCIIISGNCKIGNNCNISQGVTIGGSNRGKTKGYPIIGDNIYIGPGAKIFGSIRIGNNVAIGANCVVTKDISENAVVVGVPGKVISYKGSKAYIDRIDYVKFIH